MSANNHHVAKIFFLVFILILYSQSFCNEEVTESKSYIKEFQTAFAKQMEGEFNLSWNESRLNVSFTRIEFNAYRRATLEEARALALSLLTKLNEAVLSDPKMLSSLGELSLTPESLGVDVRFVGLHHRGYHDGSIDSVHSNYPRENELGHLWYTTTDPFSDYLAAEGDTFSTHFQEPLEDAVRLNIPTINPAIHEPTGFEEELGQILTSFEKEMKEQHGLRFQASGWMRAGKSTPEISEIRLKCMYLYPVDNQEARELILLVTEKLLVALNSSETLRPYFKEYPFSASSLKIRMLFRKDKAFVGKVPYDDGSMESAVLNGNRITYYHHIPNTDDSRLHDRVIFAKESYEEAQEAFENAPPPTLSEKVIKGRSILAVNFDRFMEFVPLVFVWALFLLFSHGWLIIILIILLILILRLKSWRTY